MRYLPRYAARRLIKMILPPGRRIKGVFHGTKHHALGQVMARKVRAKEKDFEKLFQHQPEASAIGLHQATEGYYLNRAAKFVRRVKRSTKLYRRAGQRYAAGIGLGLAGGGYGIYKHRKKAR